ncbi:hypothetical protein FB446DRAFT_840635 [Lentinula raphanica]|nr:hypothetical protein FB446DRAFT_840635 [Lentinula raphanica]
MTRRTLVLPLGIIFVLLASAIHPRVLAAPTGTTSFNEPERVPTRGDTGNPGRLELLTGATYAQDLSYSSPAAAGASGGGALKSNTAQWSRREESSKLFLQARADTGNDPSHNNQRTLDKAQKEAARPDLEKTYSGKLALELDDLGDETDKWQKEVQDHFAGRRPTATLDDQLRYYSATHMKDLITIIQRTIDICNESREADELVKTSALQYLGATSSILLECKRASPNNVHLQQFMQSPALNILNRYRASVGLPLIE